MSKKITRNWKGIVVHHTASPDVSSEKIRKWHLERGFSDIGYHFVIRKNGNLEIGRSLNKMGAHCRHFNSWCIGIVLTGNFQEYPPTIEQDKTLQTVIRVLVVSFGILPHKIFLHKDLSKTLCPGKYFKMSKITEKQS